MSLLFCSQIFCANSIASGYLAFVFWWRGACGRSCRALVKLASSGGVVSVPSQGTSPATLFRNARYHAAVEDHPGAHNVRVVQSDGRVPWFGFFFFSCGRTRTYVTANA